MVGLEGEPIPMRFFFSSRRRHTRSKRDWSSDVCSSDLSPPGEPLNGSPKVFPPSRDRYTPVLDTYTRSAFFGSTTTLPKYHPRPQMRLSDDALLQVAPASSEDRKSVV